MSYVNSGQWSTTTNQFLPHGPIDTSEDTLSSDPEELPTYNAAIINTITSHMPITAPPSPPPLTPGISPNFHPPLRSSHIRKPFLKKHSRRGPHKHLISTDQLKPYVGENRKDHNERTIEAYNAAYEDNLDMLNVRVSEYNIFLQFIFSLDILIKHNIIMHSDY